VLSNAYSALRNFVVSSKFRRTPSGGALVPALEFLIPRLIGFLRQADCIVLLAHFLRRRQQNWLAIVEQTKKRT